MVHKRPFSDEESYGVSSKHPRHLEYSNQPISFLEFVCAENMVQPPKISGECEGKFTEGDEKHEGDIVTDLPICTQKGSDTTVPGCFSYSSWASSSTSEDDDESEAPLNSLFYPEYYNAGRPIRSLVRSEEIFASVLECRPRKLVPVGPDFQANIPEWNALGGKSCSDGSDRSEPFPQVLGSDLSDHDDIENKLAGICVIPMPISGPSVYNDDKVGSGRTDCDCEDSGSVRCTRQHINEAREKLWRTLGQERFLELGFSNMGEVVAEKWSQKEELLFHEVVFSNPASLGKNFWDHLSMVFPSQPKKHIVSYYFNVFMLQRRAVQNKCDSMNIDSDDDEWQGSDDSGDDEVETAEEDEDSVVESPACHDDPFHNEILDNYSYYYDDKVRCTYFNNYENTVVGCDKGTVSVPETCSGKLLKECGPDPTVQLPGKFLAGEKGDHDVQDGSCTSSDTGTAQQVPQVKANASKYCVDSFNSMSGGDCHDFVLEHCDTKLWDVGYLTCPKNEVEFLPTCSMIEEVFGAGAWNFMARDDKGLS